MKNGMPNPGMNRPMMGGPGGPQQQQHPGQVSSPGMAPHQSMQVPHPRMMGQMTMGPGPGGMPPGMMPQQQQPQMMGQMPHGPPMPHGPHPGHQQPPGPPPPHMSGPPQPPPHPQQPPHQPPPPPHLSHQMTKQYLCRLGADTVQEIVTKSMELFQHLRTMGQQFRDTNSQQCEEKKNKIKELCKCIESCFKRLRRIYDNCNELPGSSMDYIDPKSLIPLKDDDSDSDAEENGDETKPDTSKSRGHVNGINGRIGDHQDRKSINPKTTQQMEKYRELVELNKLKNRQLKEIIDRIRKMIWDINTMLAMRRP